MTDFKEYAKQMRENAVKNEQGNIVCSPELWEKIASVIERAIIPPCKVGDVVYYINTFYQKNPIIIKCEVDALHITSGKNQLGHKKPSYALIRNESMKSLSTRVYFENFGKTVFLTKEDAERELKKRGKENER